MTHKKGDKVKIQIWFDRKIGVITDITGNLYKISVDGMSYTKGESELYPL